MFCMKCGEKLLENARFCMKCGAVANASTIAAAPESKTAPEKPKAASSRRNVIILVVVMAIVIIGAVVAVVAMGSGSEGETAEQLTLAQRYLDEEDYEQAVIEFERLLEIDPKNTDAYLGLAQAYKELGEYEKATKVLETAMDELDEDEQERIEEALEELEQPQTTPATTTTPITTTTVVTTTTTVTTTTATTAPPEPEPEPADASEIQQMLYRHLFEGGELDAEMMEQVTYLNILGDYINVGTADGYYPGYPTNISSTNTSNVVTLTMSDDSVVYTQYSNISDLSFARYLVNCTRIDVMFNNISDLSGLEDMKKLKYLNVQNNVISDLSALTDHPALRELTIYSNRISDISPLYSCKKLYKINLWDNPVAQSSVDSFMAANPECSVAFW